MSKRAIANALLIGLLVPTTLFASDPIPPADCTGDDCPAASISKPENLPSEDQVKANQPPPPNDKNTMQLPPPPPPR